MSLPRTLGRYDVVGALATRASTATSTILIAKPGAKSRRDGEDMSVSVSPARPEEQTAQLERPVAIKLFPASIGASAELAPSFLASATVAAEVRHANLPVIHEVAHRGTDLYLVMDYMRGETAAALLRALHARGETLDFTLAAHIIAEASAGLAAAHAKGILHEQLTPHDIFVGYDGSVRVLDVGIAAARTRAIGDQGTRARLVLQYSSPERCKKEELDHQSDVFSLGAILWELNTSISPFERAKEADTVKAICEEPMVSPNTAFRGLPEHISRITMQALARERIKRLPSAQALHDALRASVKLLGMGSSPMKDLAGVMTGLFETRIRDKDEMVVRILAGKGIDGLDVGEPDEDRQIARVSAPPPHPLDAETKEPSIIIAPSTDPAVVDTREPETATPVATADADDAPPVARSPSRRVYGIVAGAVAIALVLCLVAFGGKKEEPKKVAVTPPSTTSAPVNSTTAPTSTVVAAPSASVTDELDEPIVAATPIAGEETVVHIETVPAHAGVFVGGEKRGLSPMDLKLPRGKAPVVIDLKHAGFQTWRETLVPDQNQKLRLTLVAAPRTAGPGPASTAGTSTAAPYHKFQ